MSTASKGYKNAKLYAIRSHKTDRFYIGSTTQALSKRLGNHVSAYKTHLNGHGYYMTSYEILKHGDAYIELLEDFACENKEQLLKREGELIRAHQDVVVNKLVPGMPTKTPRGCSEANVYVCPICACACRADRLVQHMATHKQQLVAAMPKEQIDYCKEHRYPVAMAWGRDAAKNYCICLNCKKGAIGFLQRNDPKKFFSDHLKTNCPTQFDRYEALYLEAPADKPKIVVLKRFAPAKAQEEGEGTVGSTEEPKVQTGSPPLELNEELTAMIKEAYGYDEEDEEDKAMTVAELIKSVCTTVKRQRVWLAKRAEEIAALKEALAEVPELA